MRWSQLLRLPRLPALPFFRFGFSVNDGNLWVARTQGKPPREKPQAERSAPELISGFVFARQQTKARFPPRRSRRLKAPYLDPACPRAGRHPTAPPRAAANSPFVDAAAQQHGAHRRGHHRILGGVSLSCGGWSSLSLGARSLFVTTQFLSAFAMYVSRPSLWRGRYSYVLVVIYLD